MTASPFLLVQLSDPHIGATWGFDDPVAGLQATVDAVLELRPQPDAIVVSGDLTDHASDEEYDTVKRLLAPLGAPVHVLPGNHDQRAALRRHFGLRGAGADPINYAVDLGELRLVVLDTIRPGQDDGTLDAATLDWLDAELGAAPEAPTVIALHHPPLVTGVPVWDALGIAEAECAALARILERHPQVQRIIGGHVHRPMTAQLGGLPVVTSPSTYVQSHLDFTLQEIVLSREEPPGYAVHALVDGAVVSHLQRVP